MAYTLIYEQYMEIDGKTYNLQHFPGTIERLEQAHPNHDIYVYEPPVYGTPSLNQETGEIDMPEPIHPTSWTPVDPVAAIVIPKTQ